MRHILLSCLLALALAAPAKAQQDPIQQVISDQIAAFLADDLEAAFGHASPAIKGLFGTPERFGQMVQGGYPMVYRPSEVIMLDQSRENGQAEQRVMLRDAAGRLHVLAYAMIETSQGWQINGVRILRAPETGV
ncbi:MAG: DUF4864 domain-containing protein [Rhodobacteraceae bacterium]|nr:MAG: DUF4864 domain-containing protein [Paracoccaceae bacterium]